MLLKHTIKFRRSRNRCLDNRFYGTGCFLLAARYVLCYIIRISERVPERRAASSLFSGRHKFSQNHSSGKALFFPSESFLSRQGSLIIRFAEPLITAAAAEAQPFIQNKSGSAGTDRPVCIYGLSRIIHTGSLFFVNPNLSSVILDFHYVQAYNRLCAITNLIRMEVAPNEQRNC